MDGQLDLFTPVRPEKECAWCHERKPLREFGRHRHQADGRQRVCKECLARNWRKNHQIDEAPPVPRISAYDVIDEELDALEWVARNGGNVLAQIEHIREQLKL
jgi:hypothetical protein